LAETLIDRPAQEFLRDEQGSRADLMGAHSEALLESLLQHAEKAILTTCPEGRIIHWNAAAERLYGYSPTEALHQPLTLLSPPEEHQRVWQNLDCLRRGCEVTPREQFDRHRQGHTVPVQRRWFRLADGYGQFLGAALHSRALCSSSPCDQALTLLPALVAHDLNNLLAIINGCAALLGQQPLVTELSRRYVEQIAHAGQRAVAQTEHLLQSGRFAVSGRATSPEGNATSEECTQGYNRLDLNERIAAMEATFQHLLGDAIRLKLRPAIPLPRIEMEEGDLDQVLLNLVINARHAMPTGGWLTLETDVVEREVNSQQPAQTYVVLLVRDTGIGMSLETQSQLFTPYFTTRPGQGTGLGLVSVAHFVRRARGHITVESQPGVGTCFRLFFPVTADA
jgi:PAS domain S-box-containing protein